MTEEQDFTLYKNIYYDRNSNSIYLWEWDENRQGRGITRKRKFEYENKYFVPTQSQSEWKDIYGRYVTPKVLGKRESPAKKIKEYKSMGVRTSEMGYPAESKFLLWRYNHRDLTATLKEKGYHNVFNVGFYDIEVAADEGFDPSCVNKHGVATHPINLITFCYNNSEDYITLSTGPYDGTNEECEVKDFIHCDSELRLLEHAFKIIGELDVISGWSSVRFDLPYMFTRYQQLIRETMDQEEYESNFVQEDTSFQATYACPYLPLGKYLYNKRDKTFSIPGVQHIDYMEIYKQFTFDPHDSYSLGYVANRNIGEGKISYDGTIFTIWKTDYNKFVEYNVQDTLLLKKLDQKLGFLEVYTIFAFNSLIPVLKGRVVPSPKSRAMYAAISTKKEW